MVIFKHAIKLACYQTYRDESCNSLHRNFKMGNRNTEDSFEEVSFNYFHLKIFSSLFEDEVREFFIFDLASNGHFSRKITKMTIRL